MHFWLKEGQTEPHRQLGDRVKYLVQQGQGAEHAGLLLMPVIIIMGGKGTLFNMQCISVDVIWNGMPTAMCNFCYVTNISTGDQQTITTMEISHSMKGRMPRIDQTKPEPIMG